MSMTCHDAVPLLDAFLDGELEPARAAELERHLGGCEVCRAARRRSERLSAAVRGNAVRHAAPDALRLRLAGALHAPAALPPIAPRPAPVHRLLPLAASFVLGILVTSGAAVYVDRADRADETARELVASHVRSLMPGHLLDVQSTDSHTVKPWFAGKLDFSPPVPDFAAEGFPLLGGRLDYVGGRSVAALAYGRRQHVVNLYLWPAPGTGDGSTRAAAMNGYNLVTWRAPGWRYQAVSDLNAAELRQFAELWRKLPPQEPTAGR
jgi:anti-sigma factor RsiW